MYGLLIDSRGINRILSGQVNEYWCTRYLAKRGRMGLVEVETGLLRGFGNLDFVEEMPYSEYYQYYGTKHYPWEQVPSGGSVGKAYRFTFSDSYALSEPRSIRYIYGRENMMIVFDETELGPLRRQCSLLDF